MTVAQAAPSGVPAHPYDDRAISEADEIEAYAEAALAEAKQEGMWLAVRARWIALGVVAIMLPFLNPHFEVIYYHGLLAVFALIGYAQLKVAQVGQSRAELFLIFCDLFLMTVVTVVPNPLVEQEWPTAVQYRFGAFIWFFMLLAGGTLAYSWRTIIAYGTWTAGLWAAGICLVILFPNTQPGLTEAIHAVVGDDPILQKFADPNAMDYDARVSEIVAFLIVACTLAITVKRSSELLRKHAAVERERMNLSRYFSPTVVEELSKNDEPLKQVRTQNVAVLFVDIVGFTSYSDGKDPETIIGTLRQFLGAMEQVVFEHGGTLDKYLGDGLMATFGTPYSTDNDACNALRCGQAMISRIEEINTQRRDAGEEPINASFGLHYGPVVLGDIGSNRLEFAVLGSTVNAASRLEALTRQTGHKLIASGDIVQQAGTEPGYNADEFIQLAEMKPQKIRGLEQPIAIWAQ